MTNRAADVAAVRPDEQLDWPRLEQWLRAHVDGLDGPMQVAQFPGGHANLTYCLTFGNRDIVVRRPPNGTIAPGAHDMAREYRVLAGLGPHFDRAPQAYAFCEDTDVIGAPFVVMQRRTGVVVRAVIPEALQAHDNVEHRLTMALVDAMVDLHQVDPQAVGLERLGRPEGFVARQLSGWHQRYHLAAAAPDPRFDAVHAQLEQTLPTAQGSCIVHNDFKLDNCMFDPSNPDRVQTIFDWDMATLGDPLVELGTLLSYWPDAAGGDAGSPTIELDMSHFPGRSALVDRYAAAGTNVDALPWYLAFAEWKLAVVMQQLYRRFETGESKDARYARFGATVPGLIEKARATLESNSI